MSNTIKLGTAMELPHGVLFVQTSAGVEIYPAFRLTGVAPIVPKPSDLASAIDFLREAS